MTPPECISNIPYAGHYVNTNINEWLYMYTAMIPICTPRASRAVLRLGDLCISTSIHFFKKKKKCNYK